MSNTFPSLDPHKAKLAASIIKAQRDEINEVTEKLASANEELEKLKRLDQCMKLAHQLSERGIITKSYTAIVDRAEEIANSDKDLAVIKEAMEMAQNNFDLGTVDNSKQSVGNSTDAFAEAIMSLI